MLLVSFIIPYYYMKAKFIISLLSITSMLLSIEAGARENTRNAYPDTAIPADMSQQDNVTGKVTDENGDPLVGVMVYIEGTTIGTMTETDGTYTLKPKSGAESFTVIFSYLGMTTQKVTASPGRVINIKMQNDNELAAAVINGGYGVIQSKEDLTGSAFQVNNDIIEKLPAARVDNMLTGLVPGLVVEENTTNGRSQVSIRVRGEGSLSASKEPLWIVDGIEIYTGGTTNSVMGTSYSVSPLSFINPDDIESITVLKDATMTALYGADGANGVILITTKNAKTGNLRFNTTVRYGVATIDRSTLQKYCNAAQWYSLAKEGWTNAGYSMDIFPYQDSEYNSYSTTDTDWNDIYLNVGHTAQVNFSVSGGTEKMKNYFSGGYYAQISPYGGNSQQRYNFRDKLTFQLFPKFNVEVNMAASYNINNILSLYSFYKEQLPIFTPYMPNGDYRLYNYYSTSTTAYEPEMKKFNGNELPERKFNDNTQKAFQGDLNVNLIYKPFKGMSITSETGISLLNIFEAVYDSKNTVSGIADDTRMSGSSRRSGSFSFRIKENIRANYSRTFGKHAVNAMLGVELSDYKYNTAYATGRGFVTDALKEVSLAQESTKNGGSSFSHQRSLSFLGTVTYTYDRRYTLTVTNRTQGNSSFSTYSRWNTYTGAGIAWNIQNEKFFNSRIFHLLKLRGSFGNNGNSRVDSSAAYGTYNISEGSYYGGQAGATQGSPANPGLSWETSYIANVGIDVGIFNRLEVGIEFYNKITNDLIYDGRVSSIITDNSVERNVGSILNRGIEFNITSTNIRTRDFVWTTTFNGARNSNKILKLYEDTYSGFFDSIWTVGAPKDQLWLVTWAGVDPTTGAPMWYDKDGNLTYSFSYDNRVIQSKYSVEPTLYGGMINTFRFKDFTLSFNLVYNFGGWNVATLNNDGYDIIGDNVPIEALDHWKQPGDIAINPRYLYKNTYKASNYSTRNLIRKTYISLKNLTLTYSIPQKYLRKANMSAVDISLIGDNLYLWTPAQSRKRNSYKTMMYNDGVVRTVSLNVSLSF